MPWQDQYAIPNWTHQLMMLSPQEEMLFQQWAQQNRAPITSDYDMRAYWKNGAAGAAINPNDQRLHFPDTYKTPLHQSFSGESIFANPESNPPKWAPDGRRLMDATGNVLFEE